MTMPSSRPAADGRTFPPRLPRHSVSAAGVVVRPTAGSSRSSGPTMALGSRLAASPSWTRTSRGTVRREVLEETGVAAEPGGSLACTRTRHAASCSLVFRCTPVVSEPHHMGEAAAATWLSQQEVCDLMTEAFAVRTTDALGSGPHVRIHGGHHLLG